MKPDASILVRLTAAERKLVVQEPAFLAERLVHRIRNTPSRQPVRLTGQELNELIASVAAEWVFPRGRGRLRHLFRLYSKVVKIRAANGLLSIPPFRKRLIHGIRLTQRERESLIHVTKLPPPITQRLVEVPAGTQFLPFTHRELTQIRDEIERVLPLAVSPHKKRLLGVIEKISEV